MELQDIKAIKKETFKTLVKQKCDDLVLKYLLEGNENMSKLKYLKYYELKMQPYLSSSSITTRRKKYLFLFRTRMTNVGHNYGRKSLCPLCKLGDDTQQHMFNCIIMKLSSRELFTNMETKYEDIYSLNLSKLIKVSIICESLARKRREIMS